MSSPHDDREGLSPPPANILDFLGEEDEDDDLFEPATEQSDMTASTAEDDEEMEFSGQIIDGQSEHTLTASRCARTAQWH
jgi:hypothetical protein